jgi:uridine kinase
MTDERSQTIREIAQLLCDITLDHPTRVAVDGITASGKSTLAAELTNDIAALGRPALHVTMDGFHHPRARRYRSGRQSADGYYDDAYDFDSLIDRVLRPLGPGGSREYVTAVIDLASDTPVENPPTSSPADALLIVDGTFLQKPPTNAHWNATIFVDTDFAAAHQRGVARDAERLGGRAEAAEAFDRRYHAASRRYVDEVHPGHTATVVVDNNDPAHPRIVRQ